MKMPDFKLAGLVPVMMVFGVMVVVWLLTRTITDGTEFAAMFDTPVRDMKLGQVVGLIVFAWVLFK
jgi:hypothetical protein